MTRLSTIELYREDLRFSSGHFTIFSATHREKLHGHNYQVMAAITTEIEENGIRFDYRYYHDRIDALCQKLDLCFLLPAHSPHLRIEEKDDYYYAHFNNEAIPFLKSDVLILPITNTTIEELSQWFIEQLTDNPKELEELAVQAITVKISSNAGRCGSATWNKS